MFLSTETVPFLKILSFQRGRAVPVLIPEDTKLALEYIADTDVRNDVGVGSAKYLFAAKSSDLSGGKLVVNYPEILDVNICFIYFIYWRPLGL